MEPSVWETVNMGNARTVIESTTDKKFRVLAATGDTSRELVTASNDSEQHAIVGARLYSQLGIYGRVIVKEGDRIVTAFEDGNQIDLEV